MRSEPEGLPQPAALVEHGAFLRRLAHRLLSDDALADDVVQETFLVALRRGPRSAAALPAWLSRVCRNLALRTRRTRGRSARRDEAAATPEALPSAAALIEREAVLRDVTDAVLALPEPLREVVLLVHYEGLSAADVARRTGAPATTVRSRLQRAHAELRATLDRQTEGGRAAWGAALGGLVGHAPPLAPGAPCAPRGAQHAGPSSVTGSLTTSTLVMSTKIKLSLGAALVAIGLAAGWQATRESAPALVAVPTPAPDVALKGLPPAAPGAPVETGASERVAVTESPAASATASAEAPATGTLVLEVFYSDGIEPAAGRAFELRSYRSSNLDRWKRTARTDGAGVLRAEDLPPGQVVWDGDLSGHEVCEIVAGEVTRKRVVLAEGITLLGSVVDPANHPVADASVWLSDYGWELEGRVVAHTDARGEFRLRDIEAGRSIGAWSDDFGASHIHHVQGAASEEVPLVLTLDGPGARIRGEVVDGDGAPLAGIGVKAVVHAAADREGRDARPAFETQSDAAGRFELAGIPAGSIELAVLSDEHAAVLETLVAAGGEEIRRVFTLLPSPIVHGVVRGATGEPLAGAHVSTGDILALDSVRAFTGADGAFRLSGLTVGLHEFVVEHDAGSTRAEFDLAPGAVIEWNPELDAGKILTGKVVDGHGAPRAGFRVEAIAQRPEPGTLVLWSKSTDTDEGGQFRFAGCPDGELHVRVLRSMYDTTVLANEHHVRADGRELVIEVRDEDLPTASIAGRLLGPGGAPVSASMQASRVGANAGYNPAETDPATGAFRFDGLPPGEYRLHASPRELPSQVVATAEVGVDEALDLGALVLDEPARLTIRVNGEAGDMRPFERVSVRPWNGRAGWQDLAVGPEGRLEREILLTAGEYAVAAWGADVALAMERVEIAAGEYAEVDFATRPGVPIRFEWSFAEGTEVPRLLTWSLAEAAGDPLVSGTLGIPEPDEWALTRRLAPGSYRMVTTTTEGRRNELELEVSAAATHAIVLD